MKTIAGKQEPHMSKPYTEAEKLAHAKRKDTPATNTRFYVVEKFDYSPTEGVRWWAELSEVFTDDNAAFDALREHGLRQRRINESVGAHDLAVYLRVHSFMGFEREKASTAQPVPAYYGQYWYPDDQGWRSADQALSQDRANRRDHNQRTDRY
jgi:hypothetical protein